MAIGNIISDFNGILESVTSAFGVKKAGAYPPDIPGIGNVSSITNRPKFDDRNWQSSRGYAFQVYRVSPEGTLSDATGWSEFRLQINPQELTQDEIFAIEVTPTLRGVIVEHHGTILKDIVISGTTGVSPLRKEGGAAGSSGKPILQSGRSGYEEFHELRSYFRAYVESKRVDKATEIGELRMVFKNFKDHEYIFVEPQKFVMKRSSSRPFMYDYSIVLKGIGHTNITPRPPNYLENLDELLQKIQDYLDLAEGVISGSIGIIRRFESDIVNTFLNPLRSINSAIQAIRGGKAVLLGEFGITRRTIDSFKSEIERIEANFNDAIGRDTAKFNAASGRVSTLSYLATSGFSATRQTTYKEYQVLNALGAAKKGVSIIASIQDKIISKDIFKTNADVLAKTNNVYSFTTPNSVRTVTILADDTIQTIAARELGNVDLFKDIIVLNNLKPPYISSTPSLGVLSPGRSILIPQATPIISNGVLTNKEYNITAQMAEVEKTYGVDIRVDDDGDFVISNTKDVDLVAGVKNLGQAIAVRIYLEKGGLKRHLAVGTNLRIGSKAGAQDLRIIRDEIVTSLSSDSRIESIPFIEVIQEGNTTFINMVIKPKQSEQPIPIPIKLNNVV
jgi:hypothetical protein